jgi:hypothetical protein
LYHGLIAQVAHVLPHVRPVLLLDVRVVVFLIGTPARELNALRLAVAVQMRVDEFGPVVRIDAAQSKRQLALQDRDPFLHPDLAFPQDGTGFHPGGVNVRHVERLRKIPVGALPGVTDQVHFGESRLGHVPVIGLDRDVMLQ